VSRLGRGVRAVSVWYTTPPNLDAPHDLLRSLVVVLAILIAVLWLWTFA